MTYAGQLVAEEETDASQACRRAKQEGHVLPRDGQKEVDDLKRRTLDSLNAQISLERVEQTSDWMLQVM